MSRRASHWLPTRRWVIAAAIGLCGAPQLPGCGGIVEGTLPYDEFGGYGGDGPIHPLTGGRWNGRGGSINPGGGPAVPKCGDGYVTYPEDCDGSDLQGQTCASATMDPRMVGTLYCTSYCGFDTSGCRYSSAGGAVGAGGLVGMGGRFATGGRFGAGGAMSAGGFGAGGR